MKRKITKWPLKLTAIFLSLAGIVISVVYNLTIQNNAKDPGLELIRNGANGIKFMLRNDLTQMDYCTLAFPPNSDSFDYIDDSIIADTDTIRVLRTTTINMHHVFLNPYHMEINTKWFYYFSRLASCNSIADNKIFTLPFMIDLCYHYMDLRMHAFYLAHLELYRRNGMIIIQDWDFDKIRIEKLHEKGMKYEGLDETCTEYRFISSWRYQND